MSQPPKKLDRLESLVTLLDDAIEIPGTGLRFGLDGVLGAALPGIGDAISGVASVAVLVEALRQRVPTVVLVRMIANIGIDVLLGVVPGVGDAFDFVFKSNRRNLTLMKQHSRRGRLRANLVDYLIVGAGLLLAVLSVVVPLVSLWWFGGAVVDWLDHLVGR